MKKLVFFCCFTLLLGKAVAQTTITAGDMPVVGDTLRYSATLTAGANLNLTNTGPTVAWNYSTLVPYTQGVDSYKSVLSVNPAYAAIISNINAYGYKVADSITFAGAPISATNAYTFFSKKLNPSRFVAEGFGALVAGFPTPAIYSDEDEWYFFPLAYGNPRDSSTFKLSVSVLGLGTLKQEGYRLTKVDGAGTITTPYFTTAKNCIRVRSEVVEIDSITFAGQTTGIPRHTFDYKWLANGEHYPALWVSGNIVAGNEVPTTARYRDSKRNGLSVASAPQIRVLNTYPNPATAGIVHIDVPAAWSSYQVEVFDIRGRKVLDATGTKELDLRSVSPGQYLIRVQSGDEAGYARIIR